MSASKAPVVEKRVQLRVVKKRPLPAKDTRYSYTEWSKVHVKT